MRRGKPIFFFVIFVISVVEKLFAVQPFLEHEYSVDSG